MNPSRHRSIAVPLLAGCLLAPGAGCKSAAEYVEDADREVYEIVRSRLDQLESGVPFTIELPEDDLRSRILAGEYPPPGAEPPVLSLVECLRVASENSRAYQARRESLYLIGLALTLERWRFSIQETGSFGAFLAGDGNEAQVATGFTDFSLVKLFASGLSAVGNASLDLTRDLTTGDGWDAISDLSLTVTQPLLRGFGRDIVLEPLTQAERDVVYEARSYERFRRTFAFDVASRYFRILEQVDTLANERANYDSLVEISARNEILAEAGRLNSIEVDQARQDLLDAENSVVNARQNLETSLDDFNLFLGLPPATPLRLDQAERQRSGADPQLDVAVDEDLAIAVGLRERLDYRTALDSVEDVQRRLAIAEDALRAGLNVAVTANATSQEGKPLDFAREDFDWTAVLTFDLPIDLIPERNAFRASMIAFDVARRDASEFADGVTADIRESFRELEAARESLEIQSGAEELAERRVESVALSREAGRSSTRDLLESQQALVRARNAATRALTDYTLARLALYLDMEILRVDEEGISVAGDVLAEPLVPATREEDE